MCCGVSHKAFRLPVFLGVLMIASSYANTALSSGLASMFQKEHAPYTDIQWPVVINDSREALGLYGGVSTAYNHRGDQENAILVILPSGYIVPVLGNGDVATFPESYFAEENCAGHEYLPVSSSFRGLLPMRGMVYRSVLSNALVYIARNKESSQVQAGSRLFLDHNGTRVCKPSSSQLHVLQVMHNAPETTGLHSDAVFPLAVVAIDSLTVRSLAMKHPAGEPSNGGAGAADLPDTIGNTQEECSPGCLADALGNGSCDAECYVEACFHDQGDCDAVDLVKLQRMLADMCSPGCFSADVGDSFCDPACNVQACRFDGGDCKQQ